MEKIKADILKETEGKITVIKNELGSGAITAMDSFSRRYINL